MKKSKDLDLNDKKKSPFDESMEYPKIPSWVIELQRKAVDRLNQHEILLTEIKRDNLNFTDKEATEFFCDFEAWRLDNKETLAQFKKKVGRDDDYILSARYFYEIGQYAKDVTLDNLVHFSKREQFYSDAAPPNIKRLVTLNNAIICTDMEGMRGIANMKPGEQLKVVFSEAKDKSKQTRRGKVPTLWKEAYVDVSFDSGVWLSGFDWEIFFYAVKVALANPLDNGKWGLTIDGIIRSIDDVGGSSVTVLKRLDLWKLIEASLHKLRFARFSVDYRDLIAKRYPDMNVNGVERDRPLLDITKSPLRLNGVWREGYVLHQMPPLFTIQKRMNRVVDVYKLMPPRMKRDEAFICLYQKMLVRAQTGFSSNVYFFKRDGSNYPLFEEAGITQLTPVQEVQWTKKVEKILKHWQDKEVFKTFEWIIDPQRRGKKIGYKLKQISVVNLKVAAQKKDDDDTIEREENRVK